MTGVFRMPVIDSDIPQGNEPAAVMFQYIDLQAVQSLYVFEESFFFPDGIFFPELQCFCAFHHFCRLMADVSPVRFQTRHAGADL